METSTAQSKFKIANLTDKHIKDVIAILQPIVKNPKLKSSLKLHREKGVAKVGLIDDKVVAIGVFGVGQARRVSLTHYWIDPSLRGKMESLFFYSYIFSMIPLGYEIWIHSDNIEDFKNYVEPTAYKNEYLFKGLKSKEEMQKVMDRWVQLQKQ